MGKKAKGGGAGGKAKQSSLLGGGFDFERHLARMVMIARNKKIYKPESKNLLSKYFQKFSKAGKLEFEEGTLGLELDGIQECDEE